MGQWAGGPVGEDLGARLQRLESELFVGGMLVDDEQVVCE